jgi:pyruvate/2-oxoacid:ferredoxin oxidoreductase beta subunit
MSTAEKKIKLTIPEQEIMSPGHLACQGCGATLAMRYAMKVFGRNSIFAMPACCWSVIDGPFPYSTVGVPVQHCVFEASSAVASGIRAAMKRLGQDQTRVIAWGGDGSTFDIGIQALSGAAERNEDIIYVCYDNEAYMNTGVQRSGATPYGAWTTTTPVNQFNSTYKKDIMGIIAAHRVPYAANLSVAYPEDFIKKMEKAVQIRGTKFLHIYSPCPPGWKTRPDDSIAIARLAVQTRVFPLYEIVDGVNFTLNMNIAKPKPVLEYMKLQGRFKHLTEEQVAMVQQNVDLEWDRLLKKVGQA